MGEMFDKSIKEREQLTKEKAEERLLLEANFKARELDLRSDERVFKEKELELKQREIEVRKDELARSRWVNPWTAAFIVAVIGFVGNGVVQAFNAQSQRELEEYRSEAARILEVIKTHDPQSAKTNLKFLLSAGLVSTQKLKDDLQKFLANAAVNDVPSLPSASADSSETGLRLIRVRSSRKTTAKCEVVSSSRSGELLEEFRKAITEVRWGDLSQLENEYGSGSAGYASGLNEEGSSSEFVVGRRLNGYVYQYTGELKVDKVGNSATITLTVPDPDADFAARVAGESALRSARESLASQMRVALKKLGIVNGKCI